MNAKIIIDSVLKFISLLAGASYHSKLPKFINE